MVIVTRETHTSLRQKARLIVNYHGLVGGFRDRRAHAPYHRVEQAVGALRNDDADPQVVGDPI